MFVWLRLDDPFVSQPRLLLLLLLYCSCINVAEHINTGENSFRNELFHLNHRLGDLLLHNNVRHCLWIWLLSYRKLNIVKKYLDSPPISTLDTAIAFSNIYPSEEHGTQKRWGGGPRGVMVKAMDCRIVVSKFELQSRQKSLGNIWTHLSPHLWVKLY